MALDCLDPIERRTLSIRYGLMDGLARSIETTSELMCQSKEQTRKVLQDAFDKLKESPYSGAYSIHIVLYTIVYI